MQISRIPTLVALTMMLAGCGPHDFDACILQNMKGTKSNVAAAGIRRSCRQKFPKGAEVFAKSHDLDPQQVTKLSGRAGLAFGSDYSGTVYNGNASTTVTRVRVEVTTKSSGQPNSRIYTVNVIAAPLSAHDFSFEIVQGDKGAGYSWRIVGARGY